MYPVAVFPGTDVWFPGHVVAGASGDEEVCVLGEFGLAEPVVYQKKKALEET